MAKPIHGLLDRLIEQFAAAVAQRAEQMFARSAAGRSSRLGAATLRMCPAPGCKNPGAGPRNRWVCREHAKNVPVKEQKRILAERAKANQAAARLARASPGVRKHEIEYLRAAVLGDRLRIQTRVASMKVANSVRKTEIFRGPELLCRAETDWVYVDLARARPIRIPVDVKGAFPLEQ